MLRPEEYFEPLPPEERRVRAVSLDDVAKVAPRLLTGTPTISVISPFEPDDVEARLASVVGE